MNTVQICPPHLSFVSSLPWEIQKVIFFNIIIHILRIIYDTSEENNCYTATLAVYLLLFSASYYVHSPSTTSGARYKRSACIDMDVSRLAAAAGCDMG